MEPVPFKTSMCDEFLRNLSGRGPCVDNVVDELVDVAAGGEGILRGHQDCADDAFVIKNDEQWEVGGGKGVERFVGNDDCGCAGEARVGPEVDDFAWIEPETIGDWPTTPELPRLIGEAARLERSL